MSFLEFCSGIAIGLSLSLYQTHQVLEGLMVTVAGMILLRLSMEKED